MLTRRRTSVRRPRSVAPGTPAHDRAGRTAGFTLVEVVVALVILSVAVLGLGASATRLTTTATGAEQRALALQLVEDRIARVRLDPRYGGLDTLYVGTETNVLGAGSARATAVVHVQQTTPVPLDYKRISVTVTGPFLQPPISRQIVVAAP